MSSSRNTSQRERSNRYDILLIKQELEYQNIRSRANRIQQTILTVVSIAVSLGLFRYLIAGGAIQRVNLDIPDNLVNRCSPDALTHSGASLTGLGPSISITAVGLLILSGYLVIEIILANRAIENRSNSIFPRHIGDYWIQNHSQWINHNQNKIAESGKLLSSIKIRLYSSIILAIISLTLIAMGYYDRAVIAFIAGLLLTIVGSCFIIWYAHTHYIKQTCENRIVRYATTFTVYLLVISGLIIWVLATHVRTLPFIGLFVVLTALIYIVKYPVGGKSGRMFDFDKAEESVLHLRSRGISPVFVSLSTIVVSYIVGKYLLIMILIERFLIC